MFRVCVLAYACRRVNSLRSERKCAFTRCQMFLAYWSPCSKHALLVDALTVAALYTFDHRTARAVSCKQDSDSIRFLCDWTLLGLDDALVGHDFLCYLQFGMDGCS